MSFEWITEASEGRPTVAAALDNLACQIRRGESQGVIGMYETAALLAGASYDDVEATRHQARPT